VTDLPKKAFDAASRLPKEEQDGVAEWLLAEPASEEMRRVLHRAAKPSVRARARSAEGGRWPVITEMCKPDK
jgi:hypothetical protein